MKNIFPDELRRAIHGCDDEIRQGILTHLILNKKTTYSQIKGSLELTNGNLNHHLNLLMNGDLITKYNQKLDDSSDYSYYEITAYGKTFVNNLFESLQLKPKVLEASQYRRYGQLVKRSYEQALVSVFEKNFREAIIKIEQFPVTRSTEKLEKPLLVRSGRMLKQTT